MTPQEEIILELQMAVQQLAAELAELKQKLDERFNTLECRIANH